MPKLLICFVLFLTHSVTQCQDLILQISKIDSLIKLNKLLSDSKQFESAFKVIDQAKEIALPIT